MKHVFFNLTQWVKSLFIKNKQNKVVEQNVSTTIKEDEPSIINLKNIIIENQSNQDEELDETPCIQVFNGAKTFVKKRKPFLIGKNSYLLTEKEVVYYNIIREGTFQKGFINEYDLYVSFLIQKYGDISFEQIAKFMNQINNQPGAYQFRLLKSLENKGLIRKQKGKIFTVVR